MINCDSDNKDFLEKAEKLSAQWHADANQLYDGEPYKVHLDEADHVAVEFLHLIPDEDRNIVRAGLRFHDCMEDARKTWNDVNAEMGPKVAELSFALTNEKGRTRAERANSKYYRDMRKVKYARFNKMCDRIANARRSKNKRSGMFYKYQKENKDFCSKICGPWWLRFLQFFGLFKSRENVKNKYHEMFVCLNDILKGEIQ